MDKWDYIRKISQMSDIYGDLLIKLMDKYNAKCLIDISEEQAKDFYNTLLLGE